MSAKRRWNRTGRIYRFSSSDATAIIFGAEAPTQMWAWAVWSSTNSMEGVEYSLRRAKSCANDVLDKIEASR